MKFSNKIKTFVVLICSLLTIFGATSCGKDSYRKFFPIEGVYYLKKDNETKNKFTKLILTTITEDEYLKTKDTNNVFCEPELNLYYEFIFYKKEDYTNTETKADVYISNLHVGMTSFQIENGYLRIFVSEQISIKFSPDKEVTDPLAYYNSLTQDTKDLIGCYFNRQLI